MGEWDAHVRELARRARAGEIPWAEARRALAAFTDAWVDHVEGAFRDRLARALEEAEVRGDLGLAEAVSAAIRELEGGGDGLSLFLRFAEYLPDQGALEFQPLFHPAAILLDRLGRAGVLVPTAVHPAFRDQELLAWLEGHGLILRLAHPDPFAHGHGAVLVPFPGGALARLSLGWAERYAITEMPQFPYHARGSYLVKRILELLWPGRYEFWTLPA